MNTKLAALAFLLICSLALDVAADARQELSRAYKKEYAFLKAEKEALFARLGEIERETERRVSAARSEIDSMQRKLLALRNQADRVDRDLAEVERRTVGAEERADLLVETIGRAGDTLRKHGYELPSPGEKPEEQIEIVERMFTRAAEAIERSGSIRRDRGNFFLADGTQTEGSILRVGNVASFGLSDSAGGALAPAGAGRLKLWHEDAFATARDLFSGESPQQIAIFLYESLSKGIEEKEEKSFIEEVQTGGPIAWVIVALGGLALLMILARLFILLRASSRTDSIIRKIGPLVDQGLNREALDVLRPGKGSGARVIRATIRNLDRDRQHLEDLVSEAILHESPTVERFGTTILVIAAVAPLLGLLGTVTGMIATFDVITEFGTGDPKLLSGGISEALVTTKLGLMVAIPALLLGTLLSGRASAILESMERAALQVMNRADAFKARERQSGTKRGSAGSEQRERSSIEGKPEAAENGGAVLDGASA